MCICNGILVSPKNNEILSFSPIWMDLKGIMLNNINQRKQIPCDIIIYGILSTTKQNKKIHKYRK